MSKALADLNVGDEVVILNGRSIIGFGQVTSITPTGRFNVGRHQYRPNGMQVGGIYGQNYYAIEPRGEQHEGGIALVQAVQRVEKAIMSWRYSGDYCDLLQRLTLEQATEAAQHLEAALAILKRSR